MATVDQTRLDLMNKYWNAANYLTIGQIYLKENPLLQEPLLPEHIKPRLLGHWGTSPGLSFIYVHLNRLIQDHHLDMIYMAGPGHGGPAIISQRVSRRNLFGDLSRNPPEYPGHTTPFSPVLDTWRRSQPCQRAYPRLYP